MNEENMNCVVTGGTEGIGKSIIYCFAEQGFDIITCARNQTKLDLLKSDVEKKFAVRVSVLSVDVSIKEEVVKFGKFVNDICTPEVLINNAGIFTPGMIDEEPEDYLNLVRQVRRLIKRGQSIVKAVSNGQFPGKSRLS